MAKQVIPGDRFGLLRVLYTIRGLGSRKAVCKCECGGVKNTLIGSLISGGTRSCGCLVRITNSTHGMSKHPLFNTWAAMVRRCHIEKDRAYKRYGARGITVCEKWRTDPKAFFDDMPPRPAGASLDRIDNNKGYSPENCRWATNLQQANNTRNCRYLSFNGVTQSISDWARTLGIKRSTISARLNDCGWSVEKTLGGARG